VRNDIGAPRRLAGLALGTVLALGACQSPQQGGQQGGVYFDASAIPPPGNLTRQADAPPGGPPGGPMGVSGAVRPGFDGAYTGSMYRTSDPGGMSCAEQVPIYGFTVSNGVVNFGQFRGNPIAPDGSVQLQEGQLWLSGSFDGRQFVGNLTPWGVACTYRMMLNRS